MVLPPSIIFRSAQATDPDDDFGCLGGYHIQYDLNNSIVNVVILPMRNVVTNKPLPEEGQLLDKLDEAATRSDEGSSSIQDLDRLDQIEDEIQEWMESKCESTLIQLLSSMGSKSKDIETTLKTLLSPSIINLQLKIVDNGHVSVIRHDGVPPWPEDWHLGQPLGLGTQLPIDAGALQYDVSEIVVVEKHAVPIVTIKHQHQHLRLRCKLNTEHRTTLREHGIYQNLSKLNAIQKLRIPAFYGCVTDRDGSKVVALLIEDIPVQFTTLEHAMGCFTDDVGAVDPDAVDTDVSEAKVTPINLTTAPTLAQEPPTTPSVHRRRKWACQIKEIMQILHEHDIIWGDVKPANIVIDVNDDAWAIDFGGGFTRPWKSPADADTMLGNLSALHRIEEYLHTGKEPSMPEASCGSVDNVKENDDNRTEAPVTAMQLQDSNQTDGETKAYDTKRKHRSCSSGGENGYQSSTAS